MEERPLSARMQGSLSETGTAHPSLHGWNTRAGSRARAGWPWWVKFCQWCLSELGVVDLSSVRMWPAGTLLLGHTWLSPQWLMWQSLMWCPVEKPRVAVASSKVNFKQNPTEQEVLHPQLTGEFKLTPQGAGLSWECRHLALTSCSAAFLEPQLVKGRRKQFQQTHLCNSGFAYASNNTKYQFRVQGKHTLA